MSCRATTREGLECMGTAKANGFCAFHDPANEKALAKGRRKGGEVAMGKSPKEEELAPDFQLETAKDALTIIAAAINKVRKGKLDPKIGTAVGYLVGVGLQALKQGAGGDKEDDSNDRPLKGESRDELLRLIRDAAERGH